MVEEKTDTRKKIIQKSLNASKEEIGIRKKELDEERARTKANDEREDKLTRENSKLRQQMEEMGKVSGYFNKLYKKVEF